MFHSLVVVGQLIPRRNLLVSPQLSRRSARQIGHKFVGHLSVQGNGWAVKHLILILLSIQLGEPGPMFLADFLPVVFVRGNVSHGVLVLEADVAGVEHFAGVLLHG